MSEMISESADRACASCGRTFRRGIVGERLCRSCRVGRWERSDPEGASFWWARWRWLFAKVVRPFTATHCERKMRRGQDDDGRDGWRCVICGAWRPL